MPKLFTDAYIRALKPKGTRYEVGEPGGLKIRVGTSGKKTWVYTYRQNRRLRRMTLGQYGKRKPALSVAAARAAVATARIAQTEGHDPAASISAERTARKTALTVNDLISEYIKRYARKYKKSWCEDERMLNKDVKKYFGSMLAKDVKRKDILFFLEDLSARAPIAANRTFAVLRKMFNWAAEREIVEMSPCFQVKMPNKTTARDRVLSFAEIRQLWQVLSMDRDEFEDTIPGKWPTRQTRLAIKLALVTAQRRNEIAGARRSEFDLDKGWWTIPAERAKNGISHRVPLSSLAIGIIDEMLDISEQSDYLVPGRDPSKAITADAITRAVGRIRDTMDIPHWTEHDLRRTAASHMASLGVNRLVLAKILNHTDRSVTAVYDRHSYDAEKAAALTLWAENIPVSG